MSASLVGSEMCIRDRRRFMLLLGPSLLMRARRLIGNSWVPNCARTLGRPCLLYTSDAADDM
eukprot:5368710-Alexandrium_andersonii.AAC.1